MEKAQNYSPLNLAYLGDAVFELCVRKKLMENGSLSVNNLNKRARVYVQAESQALMYHKILPMLNGQELAVLKRGRNAKSYSSAKNASVSDYRHATGLEALFGFLYIADRPERIQELFEACLRFQDIEYGDSLQGREEDEK